MLFTQKKELEDMIIEVLQKDPMGGSELLEQIQLSKKHTSKETFYRVLRRLLSDDVVIKNKRLYMISSRWLEQLYEFSKKIRGEDSFGNGQEFLSLEDGNQITYNFKNAKSMYNYWAYIYDVVYERHNHKQPILIYHPHEWFIYGRVEAETLFLGRFTKDKQLAFLSIGGKTLLDKNFKKDWANEFLKINIGFDLGQENTDYINVVGDYIFKVSMSSRFAKDIDLFFQIHTDVTQENINELMKLVERTEKAKLVFKHSKKEADKLRMKFKKYFVFPR
jgi:DNA-binding PadR family transcriptional regulator